VHAHVRERARVRVCAMHVYGRASARQTEQKVCNRAFIHLIWDVCMYVYVCVRAPVRARLRAYARRACVRARTCAQAVCVDLLYDHACVERGRQF
jgi:hypothetical protein